MVLMLVLLYGISCILYPGKSLVLFGVFIPLGYFVSLRLTLFEKPCAFLLLAMASNPASLMNRLGYVGNYKLKPAGVYFSYSVLQI